MDETSQHAYVVQLKWVETETDTREVVFAPYLPSYDATSLSYVPMSF